MLKNYPEFQSDKLDEVETLIRVRGQANRVDLPHKQTKAPFVTNAVYFDQGALAFIRFDRPIGCRFDPASHFHLSFQTAPEVSEIVLDGKVVENATSSAAYIIPSDQPWSARYPAGLHKLCLRVDGGMLRRKWSALLDSDSIRMDLRQPSLCDFRHTRFLRQSTFRFARELEIADQRFVPALVATAVEDISVRMLVYLGNWDAVASRPPAAPALAQLKRIEDYIVANLAEPLQVETLAQISSVSARSIFRYFHSRHNCTPQEYLRRARLEQANLLLQNADDTTSVISVALRCGFHSLGHFARSYREMFGELPSNTLGKRRRGLNHRG
ncbi:AraC family transcriptional regulator [Bradyrhizobium sp. UFLA05-109]